MLDLQQLLSRGREGLFCGGEEWKWWWCCSGTGLWFAGGYFLVQPTTPSDVQPSPQAFLILRSVGNICHYTHVIWASSLKLLCFTWRENLHSLFLYVHMEQWCPLKSHKDYILFFLLFLTEANFFFNPFQLKITQELDKNFSLHFCWLQKKIAYVAVVWTTIAIKVLRS